MIRYLLTILFGLACIGLASCSNTDRTSNDQNAGDSSKLIPDSELFGATIYMYDKDLITAEIQAEKIVKFESIDSTMAYKLNVNVLDSLGHTTTHLVGDSGVIRESSALMDVYGNVVLITKDTARLETDYLHWNSRKHLITTDAFVRISRDADLVTGWGLEADENLNRVKILDQVSGSLSGTKKADSN